MDEHTCDVCTCDNYEYERVEKLKDLLAQFFEQTGYSAYDMVFGIVSIAYDLKEEAEEEGDFNFAELVAADIDAYEACLDKLEQNADFFGNCKGSGADN